MTWWKWSHRNSLDETKKWALESPHLELWVKRYECFSARDLSVKKSSQTGPLLEKQKAHSCKYVFQRRRHISAKCAFYFSSRGPVCDDFFTDRSLAEKHSYLFPIAPNQVNPKPTSSFRRARTNGIIFTMFSHSENDHFALALNQPPPRENVFWWFFPRASRTSSRWFHLPQASHTLHLHDYIAVTWFLYLKSFKI